jgi:hypothetical protein
MSEKPPVTVVDGERVDRRGTPPGAGTVVGKYGGQIGNPPFVPTDAQRKEAKRLAQVFPPNAEHLIARMMGISRNTLRIHFHDDVELGRAEMLAQIGGQMMSRAINADAVGADGQPVAKGDLEAQKFVLMRYGGWNGKQEVVITHRPPPRVPDLSDLPMDDVQEALPVLRAIAERMRQQQGASTGEPDDEPRRIN